MEKWMMGNRDFKKWTLSEWWIEVTLQHYHILTWHFHLACHWNTFFPEKSAPKLKALILCCRPQWGLANTLISKPAQVRENGRLSHICSASFPKKCVMYLFLVQMSFCQADCLTKSICLVSQPPLLLTVDANERPVDVGVALSCHSNQQIKIHGGVSLETRATSWERCEKIKNKKLKSTFPPGSDILFIIGYADSLDGQQQKKGWCHKWWGSDSRRSGSQSGLQPSCVDFVSFFSPHLHACSLLPKVDRSLSQC